MNFKVDERKDVKKEFIKIYNEIKKRASGKHCNYNIIGVEIKLRRCAKNLTLAELAEDICSISYLCKIEQSQIKASLANLNDFCSKLDIDDETLNVLMKLDKELLNMVDSYFENDKENIEKIYLSGKHLKNYRYKIVELIYYIYNKNYDLANEIICELNPIVNVLNDIDLLIYAIFYDILNFNFLNYNELYDELKYLPKVALLTDNINYLIEILSIKCLLIMNRPLIVTKIDDLSNEFYKISRFDLIDELRYFLSLYFLFNGEKEGFDTTKMLISKNSFKKDLNIFQKIINEEKIDYFDLEDTDEFPYLLGLAKIDSEKSMDILNNRLDLIYLYGFNSEVIEYLTIKDTTDKYDYILLIALPSFKASKNVLVGKYFAYELLKITKDTSKYKLFYQFHTELNF